ncbi:MAG: hypothetical protein Q8O04_06880 [Deltaproteobacteria bacterium]|nr:hypothetical protein [Deltaproteobacteria bacterium]
MQQNLASIDVGTNTLRLWIGKIKDPKILTLHSDRANVRLGEGLKQQGVINEKAAMDLVLRDYISELVHGHVLTINKLLALFDRLRVKKAKDRLVLAGLEPGREDIILAGLIIWIGILKAFSLPEMTVSHNGILEGIAIDMWERNREICCTR